MKDFILYIFLLFNMAGSDLNKLIEAEKSFSALSSEKGIKTAFLTYLDDDAILFMPQPVKGKQKYRERDTIAGLLKWEPQFAYVSRSGNLGYTTGPWKLSRDSEEAYGHFVSIWKKKNDQWKVILDTGIDYPDNYMPIEKVISPELSDNSNSASINDENHLLKLDESINAPDDYKNELCVDIIFLRIGFHPIEGISDVQNYIAKQNSRFTVDQQSNHIADGGDLAYSYGFFTYDESNKDCYLRIWRKGSNNQWQLALELAKPAK